MPDTNIARFARSPFPVQLRIVRYLNEDGDPYITLDEVRADVEAANVIWRNAGFSFRILSDEIRNDAKYRVLESYEEFLELEEEEWSPTNPWINVYYGAMLFAAGVCSFPEPREAHAIAVHYERFTPAVLAHEFGHYFNVYHTFQDDIPETESEYPGDPRNVMSYGLGDDVTIMHLTETQVEIARRSIIRDRPLLLMPALELV